MAPPVRPATDWGVILNLFGSSQTTMPGGEQAAPQAPYNLMVDQRPDGAAPRCIERNREKFQRIKKVFCLVIGGILMTGGAVVVFRSQKRINRDVASILETMTNNLCEPSATNNALQKLENDEVKQFIAITAIATGIIIILSKLLPNSVNRIRNFMKHKVIKVLSHISSIGFSIWTCFRVFSRFHPIKTCSLEVLNSRVDGAQYDGIVMALTITVVALTLLGNT